MAILKGATEYIEEDLSTIIGTNFEPAYHLCQLGHPFLKPSGGGNIVFISSVAGVLALPTLSIYATSKGILR